MAQTADTILAQLGGSKFLAMTGAKHLTSRQDGLNFQLPSNITKTNGFRITLTAADDYKVEGFRIRGAKFAAVAVKEGVLSENLQAVFESMAGLRTSL